MMNDEHVSHLLADYALDLLPAPQRRQVAQHAARCPACRAALRREQRLGQMVRTTLQRATQPPTTRLARRMPAIPRRGATPRGWLGWQNQLAPLALMIGLLLGSLGLQISQASAWSAGQMGLPPATAALIQTPEAQGAADPALRDPQPLPPNPAPATAVTTTAARIVPSQPVQTANPAVTPLPAPTPVTAALTLATN